MHPEPDISQTTVGFISLGCAKNLVDSQIMAGRLIGSSIRLVPVEDADIIVVNTCSFIHDAREESMEAILSACEQKKRGNCRAVLVAGCLPQRYADRISTTLPDVDAFIGIDQLDDIPSIVTRLAKGAHGIVDITPNAHRLFDPDIPVVFSTGAYAYLKIAEGCNHRCAFCAIPGIRGRHRSRTIDALIHETATLLESGFREINIISQDITHYGRDLNDGTNLPRLLRELSSIEGSFRIRLLYAYPTGITDELLEVMADSPKICSYLDIPIQHSHPEILKKMLRSSTIPYIENMTSRIRAAMPDATIRTTCLVGFPGETDQHFNHLLQFCAENRFDNLGAFIYSPEENTPAWDMQNTPPENIAQKRYDELMHQQQMIVAEKSAAQIGKTVEILLEHDAGNGDWIGRTRSQAPDVDGITLVQNLPPNTSPGTIISATITAADNYDLTATLTK